MAELVKAANKKASGIAILFGDSILLGKRCEKCHLTGSKVSYPGYWSIFGGIIEAGETPKEAAGRELYEETKIFIDFKDISFFKKIKNQDCDFYFHYYRSNKILIPELNAEHTEYGWFKLDSLNHFAEKIDNKIVKCILGI